MSKKTINIVQVIAAIMLFIAIFEWDYFYYQLLRVVVFVIALMCFWFFYKQNETGWCWFYAILAILFNPIAPIYLDKGVWHIINISTSIMVLISYPKVKHSKSIIN